MTITSTSNNAIKHLQQLLKKSSLRKKEGLYVVEGWRSFNEVPAELLEEVFIAESQQKNASHLKKKPIVVADFVMESVSDTKTSQGIIAIVRMRKETIPDFKRGGLYICCEHLQDPGNLGTIIRMSEAAGVDAVILSSDTVDLYNPKVVRATMGTIFRVKVIVEEDLAECASRMIKAGVNVYGAALENSVDYAEIDYTQATAFVIGNEANGLTDSMKAACSRLVHIPMEGNVESLNASVAASVLAFEAYRQKRLIKK